jgi:regulator of sigma E protease
MDGAIQSFIVPFLFALITFIPLLLVLVVFHELGHYFTGRAFGIKVLEFGIGYPPKAFGIYTGRTRVIIDQDTALINFDRLSDLSPRQLVKISSTEDTNGDLVARMIQVPGAEPPARRSAMDLSRPEVAGNGYLQYQGQIREVNQASLTIVDTFLIDRNTQLVNVERLSDLPVGRPLRIRATINRKGNLAARIVEALPPGSETQGTQPAPQLAGEEYLTFEGRFWKLEEDALSIGDVIQHDRNTALVNLDRISDLRPSQLVRVTTTEDDQGNPVARAIEVQQSGIHTRWLQSLQEFGKDEYLKHEGRVREVGENSLVVADMVYSLNWLPLGGFVRLAGESNPEVPRSLASKGAGPRAIVLAAGSFMNAILPIILFTIMFMIPREVQMGNVVVTEVAPQSPAAAAGLRPGDVITRANGEEVDRRGEFIRSVSLSRGAEMEWAIDRGGRQEVIYLTPRVRPPEGQGPTGVGIDLINVRTEKQINAPWTALALAFTNTWVMLVLLEQEVSAWISGEGSPEFSGPIGIAQISGEITRENGLRGWMVLAILFSLNLAILNILPIPMLDGGRLLFVAIEWVRRGKRIPPEKEGLVHLIGFVVLIGFIILISANDVYRLIQGGSPLGG